MAKNPNPQVEFKLNYNGNATGVSNVPESQTTKSSAASVEFTISSQEPTRNGYDFLGWSTDSNATTATYRPSGKITVAKNNNPTTLYAVWKEQTPPVTEPDDPKVGENLIFEGNIVDVICETTDKHNVSYGLMNGYYSVSDKKQLTSDSWQCAITIDLNKYFTLYNSEHTGHERDMNHKDATATLTIYPTWYASTGKWISVSKSTAKIFVKCDATQPEGPGDTKPTFSDADGRIKVICVVKPANHDPAEKTYKLSDGNYTDNGFTTDQAGKITYSISLDRKSFIKKFDTDTNKTHTDKETNADTRITWTWNAKEKAWVLDTMTDIVATILCECETSNIPNEPTRDDIFKALNGLVTVTCINRVWKDGNKVMDCGEGKYAAKAGIVGQNYTIRQDENNANAWIVTFPVTNFVKAFKQTPAHDLYSNNTLNWSITWTDKKWTAEPVKPGVDDLVKLTHAPTDWREVNKVTHNGIWTSCENGQTGKCEYGIAVAFAKGDVVSVVPEAGVPGSYIATFKVSTYADTCAKACNDKNFKNSSRTHDLLTQETVQWRLYATKQADEEIGNQVLNHVWAAEPVTKGTDDVCQVAHRVKVTFDENYNNASTTEVMYKYNTNEVKEGTFPADPVREGYTFQGWNTKANGNGTAFDTKTVVTADVIVYAKWEPTQYTITYDLRDSKASNNPANPVTYTVEDAVTLQAPTTKRNNQFLEWRDEKGNVITEIAAGTTGNVKVYAYWKCPIKLYELTANGKVQLGNTIYVTEGTSYPLPDGSTYAKNGYTFKCWYETEGDLRIDKNRYDKAVTPTVTKEWKLYGKNIPIEYTITYVLNDKDAKHTNQTTYTVEDEFAITDATNGSFGRKFLEWRAADSKTGKAVNKIEKGTTGSITLYAIWQNPVNYFQVDKDGNKTLIRTDYVTVHEDYQTIAAIDKAGYTFDGWYKSTKDFGADSKKVTGFTATNSKAEWKLYGKLTPNEYTVTFDANADDDKSAKVTPKTKPVTFDAAYGELAKASRDGYDFLGWYTEKNGGTKVEVDTVVTTAEPHTLYAHWEARSDTPYKVEYYQEQLNGKYTLVETKNLKGTTDTTANAEEKSYTGFTLDKTVEGTKAFGTVTGDGKLVLKLYYTRNIYTVTFDVNGGNALPKDQATKKVKYQETATKPTDPTKSGYTFGGWYTDKKCTKGNEFSFDTKITGDITLYAKWDVKRTGTNPDAKNPYIKDNTTKTDGKKVESGKTFDAGIAMYVGLSILSVTGSAVVIRKRKDF